MKKAFKIILRIGLVILSIFLLLSLAIQTKPVQNFVVDQITTSLSETFGANISIGTVQVKFFKSIQMNEIYVQDLQRDTLLYIDDLSASIGLFSLLKQEIFLDDIRIQKVQGNIKRSIRDSSFNYEFLFPATAPQSTVANSPSSNNWLIGLGSTQIDQLRFQFLDSLSQTYLYSGIETFLIEIDQLDLPNQAVNVRQLELSEPQIRFENYAENTELDSSQANLVFPFSGWGISLQEGEINQGKFLYRQHGQSITSGQLDPGHLDLQEINLKLENFRWDSTQIELQLNALSGRDKSGFELSHSEAAISLGPDKIAMEEFVLETPSSKIRNSTNLQFHKWNDLLDFSNRVELHTVFKDTRIDIRDVKKLGQFIPETFQVKAPLLLSGRLDQYGDSIHFKDLNLNWGEFLQLKQSGWISNFTQVSKIRYSTSLQSFRVDYKKTRLLLPELDLPKRLDQLGTISLNGKLNGTADRLNINKVRLSTSSATLFQASGQLQGIQSPDQLVYDLAIDSLKTNVDDLSLLAEAPLPDQVYALQKINYRGVLKGDLRNIKTDGTLTSAIGALQSNASIQFDSSYSDANYSGSFKLKDFDLGLLLGDTSAFGKTTLLAKVEGAGIRPDQLNTQINIAVDDIEVNQYNYQYVIVEGKIDSLKYRGQAWMDDPNLAFEFNGLVDLNQELPDFQFTCVIDTIDIQALNLSSIPTRSSMIIQSDFRGSSLDDFVGSLYLEQVHLNNDGEHFFLDSLALKAVHPPSQKKTLSLKSNLINAEVAGQFKLADIPALILNYINDYFPLDQYLSPEDQPDSLALEPFVQEVLPDQELELDVFLYNIDRLAKLYIPDLKQLDSVRIQGAWDTKLKEIQLNCNIPSMQIADWSMDSLSWNIQGDVQKLNTDFNIKKAQQGETAFYQNNVQLILKDKILQTALSTNDVAGNTLFKTAAQLLPTADTYQLKFDSLLILNEKEWTINPRHHILFANEYLNIKDFDIQRNAQAILIDSYDKSKYQHYTPIHLRLQDFKLGEISNILNLESFSFSGLLNGSLTLHDITNTPHYIAELAFNNVVVNDSMIGNLNLSARQRSDTPVIDIAARMGENGKDLNLAGVFNIDNRTVDLQAKINRFPMVLIDPFSAGGLRNSTGYLIGNIDLQGPVEAPDINGELGLKNAATTLSYLNTRYQIPEHTVYLNSQQIDFGKMQLFDMQENSALLSGQLFHQNFRDIQLNLSFETNRFNFLNTKAGANDLYYGTLNLFAKLNVTGGIELPNIEITAKTLEQSRIWVNALTEEQLSGQAEYIIYGRPDTIQVDSLFTSNEALGVGSQRFNLLLNLEVSPETELTVLVDPVSGDQLTVRGRANLTIKVPPSGLVNITGTYIAESGQYQFNYENLVKRSFRLRQGSQLSFVGDPYDTRFDINASYSTRTPIYPLIANESRLSETAQASTKERQDVEVLLNMKGDLAKPEIGFDINIEDLEDFEVRSAVNNKLGRLRSDDSELNKQVFGLLLLNSFVMDQSATASLSTTGENIALSSVSNLISNQLNRLSDKYLDGLGLTFDLESYRDQYNDQAATRTNLNVGLNQSLFDDRLTVKVGGVVQLNSLETASQESGFSNIAGDFVLEYRLDKSGNYILRVFQKSDYDAFNDSNANKTGVGINFKKSFGQ